MILPKEVFPAQLDNNKSTQLQLQNSAKKKNQVSDDIRLLPEYIQHIEHYFQVTKTNFTEAFVNGGEFLRDNWINKQLWINPSWEYLPHAVNKVFNELPKEFLFIVPECKALWYTILSKLKGIRKRVLPKTLAHGVF